MPTQISGTNGVDKIQNNTVSTSSIQALAVSGDKLSGGQSGTAPIYAARAWVNFDGTTATPSTIRASGNVSSISRTATGLFTINLTTAMPDANYAISGAVRRTVTSNGILVSLDRLGTPTTTEIPIATVLSADGSNSNTGDIVCLVVFR